MAFFQALALQNRVLKALFVREVITRFGRENFGFLWVYLEPLVFGSGVTLMWASIRDPYEHGVPIISFVVTGYMPIVMFRHCMTRSLHTVAANHSLLYHRRITFFDLFLTRIYLEVIGTTFAFAFMVFILIGFGLMDPPRDYPLILGGWLYMSWLSCTVGLIVGPLSELSEWVEKIVNPMTYLIVPFSGAFFMVDWLPYKLGKAAQYIPSVNCFEMIRAGQLGGSIRTYYDAEYLTGVCIVLTFLGLFCVRRLHGRVAIS